jgi:hypothetical protein
MDGGKPYWFPAKRFGWGWGPPKTWQGWVVAVLWAVVLFVGMRILPFHGRIIAQGGFAMAMIAIYMLICYWRGEPPRWRWGDDS